MRKYSYKDLERLVLWTAIVSLWAALIYGFSVLVMWVLT